MKSAVWISYDLGVNGDYESLYSWLDIQGAKECGTSVAYLTYTHVDDLMESLRAKSQTWFRWTNAREYMSSEERAGDSKGAILSSVAGLRHGRDTARSMTTRTTLHDRRMVDTGFFFAL